MLHKASNSALQAYLELVRELNPDGQLQFYPGSPGIARLLLRDGDSIQATELHPADFPLLETPVSGPPALSH